jgi:hypothetical protein
MKKPVNIKSALAGVVLGIVVFATVGAALERSEPVGRYEIVAVDNRALVLDTVTGQVWQQMLVGVVNDEEFARTKR